MAQVPTTERSDWLTPARFALLLGLLVVATFPAVLLHGQTFVIRDFGLFSYPVARFYQQAFWRGELPLWNPLSHCGMPFLAQWNTLVLYPPSLLYLVLPLTWSLPFFCIAHLFWGGLGMFCLARQWTGRSLPAALAGVVFAFNGLMLNFLMWPSHVATFSWFPWVVWLVPEAWRGGGTRLVWATLAASLQMLAGGPETILLTWTLLFLLAVCDGLNPGKLSQVIDHGDGQGPSPESQAGTQVTRRLILVRFLGMALLVALICSAQLLPFLQLLSHSQRESGYGSAAWAMPPSGLANFLIPLFRMSPTPQGVFFQNGQYWTSSYYAGLGTVFLVAVAAWRGRDGRVWLVLGLLLVSLVLALGDFGFLYRAVRYCFPGLGFVRYPVKFVILVLALAPLLAAVGLKALTCDAKRPGAGAWICLALLVLLTGGLVALEWRTTWQNAVVRLALLGLVFFLITMLGRAEGRRRVVLGGLLLLACWLDLATHVPTQNPAVSPTVYTPNWARSQAKWEPQPKLGQARAMQHPGAQEALKYRVLPSLADSYLLSRLGLVANCNLLDDLPQTHGFFSLMPEECNNATLVPYVHTNLDFTPLLDFMGVAQIDTPNDPFAWIARPSAMPLVTAGQRPLFVDDQTAFGSFSQTNTDFRQTVFLPPEARDLVTATAQPGARVQVETFLDQVITLHADAPGPALVVISQSYYPAWKAFIDGREVRLWRANYAFQAVQVPAGPHHIRLVYHDETFHAGVVLSLLGLLAALSLWVRSRRAASLPPRPAPA